MGRITIFTATHCLFSLQVKHELTKRNLPFSEVNLTEYPEKRSDVFMLTRRMTTPQVFFNTRYIGGCDATLQLLDEWDHDTRHASPLKKYKSQIARFPDPSNPHLALPESQSMEETSSSESSSLAALPLDSPSVTLELPDGTARTYTVSDLIEELSEVLPLGTLSYHLTSYKNSVTGTAAVAALMKHFQTETREEAEDIGKQLGQHNIIHHVCFEHRFQDTKAYFYRLQAHQTPHILNSLYLVSDEEMHWDNARAEALVERLEVLVGRLERECYALEDGGGIRYSEGIKQKSLFRELEEGICLFQAVEFDTMKPKELLAWGLNVYNIMLKIALFKRGIPKKESTQQIFLREIQFNVGGKLYSFIDWLSVISAGKVGGDQPVSARRKSVDPATIKNNRKMFPKRTKSFDGGSSPLRRSSRMSTRSPDLASPADYRVYFATHLFWARSSAMPHFTAQNLDKELTIAALAFCAEDSNVKVDTAKGELSVSNVFSWYRKDFCTSSSTFTSEISDSLTASASSCDRDLTSILFSLLESPKKLQLQQLLYSGSKTKLKISFHADDWTINALGKDYVTFQASSIDGNCSRI